MVCIQCSIHIMLAFLACMTILPYCCQILLYLSNAQKKIDNLWRLKKSFMAAENRHKMHFWRSGSTVRINAVRKNLTVSRWTLVNPPKNLWWLKIATKFIFYFFIFFFFLAVKKPPQSEFLHFFRQNCIFW